MGSTKLLKVISRPALVLLRCSRSQACASRLVLKPRFRVCLHSPFRPVQR